MDYYKLTVCSSHTRFDWMLDQKNVEVGEILMSYSLLSVVQLKNTLTWIAANQ